MSDATPQAGVFSGMNPARFNSGDPIVLFIIQAIIILSFCRLLAIPLGYLRQPRVISEVLAGIILGPSVMGRIPNFQNTIFPKESLPFINLIATLGLVFFLFQVGLEVDLRIIKKKWQQSVSIAVVGMAFPFGLGAAVSVGLYKLENEGNVPFSSFVLFLGVAMAITAFPVLARILAELKLLRTKVGAITMAAGLLNDCTAWVLLALVVALLNSTGGLEALYVFLSAVGYSLFLIFIIGPLYRKLCAYTKSYENGPSPLLMTVTLAIVLISAFVTDIIGVHAIFGGFIAGVIVPHENDLAIKITEKIEDVVNIVFLPLYFTLSGLKTQIGLLNTGTVWGYVILVIFLACFGKITGCAAAAKLTGMTTRESLTVGFLMSCKGLVELIVLNIGHDAGVLNDQIFVIMVVMALITTIMTTPVVMWLYPEWYQKQTAERFNDGEDGSSTEVGKYDPSIARDPSIDKLSKIELGGHFNLVTMLNRIETVPSVMTLIRLLKQDKADTSEIQLIKNKLSIHVLRLLELTQRSSDVMKIQDIHETKKHDPVLAVLRTFTRLIGIESAHTHLEFSYPSDYMKTVQDYSESVLADMILLPWVSTAHHHRQEPSSNAEVNPFDQVTSIKLNTYQISDAEFASAAYSIKDFSVGLFIDRGFGHSHEEDLPFQIVVPFMGGVDDRAALLFALRLSRQSDLLVLTMMGKEKETTYATPLSVAKTLNISEDDNTALLNSLFVSETESNIALQCVVPSSSNSSFSVLSGLKRPLGKNDLIVVGRSLHGPVMFTPNPTETPGQQPISREFKAALGNSAYEILSSGTVASLVVVQGPIGSGASFEA